MVWLMMMMIMMTMMHAVNMQGISCMSASEVWTDPKNGSANTRGHIPILAPPPKKLLRSKAAGYSLGEIGENHTDKKLSSLQVW